jgi:adenylate cyclase
MGSLGVAGRVQVTSAVKERLSGTFGLESRGYIDVNGEGPTPTWLLMSRNTPISG